MTTILRTLCLATSKPPAEALAALERFAGDALRDLPGLRQVGIDRVLRHIPTDYIANDRPYAGVVAQADDIDMAIDLHFADAAALERAAAAPAMAAFIGQLRSVAELLFSLDSEPNLAVPLKRGAVDGGFRRWLLLTRNAPTRDGFRDAWFGRHASLVSRLPLLDGYVQNLVSARHDGDGRPVPREALPIDGIAEVCFADEAAMTESYASDARLPLRDDGRDLNARVSTLLVQGRVLRDKG